MELVKSMVRGTAVEPIARRVLAALTPGNRNRQYDVQTMDVLRRVLKEDSNCVDVGCHAGLILKEMLKRAPHGAHYAFEPIPELYDRLARDFKPQRVTVLPYALSDEVGDSTFEHVVSNPAYSGLRKRRYDRPNEQVQQIPVQMRRLDDMLPTEHCVHLIKVDVEGAELQVLRGAQATLKRWKPVVVFEHGLGGMEAYGTKPEQVHELLEACGLRVWTMKDWLRNRPPMGRAVFEQRVLSGEDYYFLGA